MPVGAAQKVGQLASSSEEQQLDAAGLDAQRVRDLGVGLPDPVGEPQQRSLAGSKLAHGTIEVGAGIERHSALGHDIPIAQRHRGRGYSSAMSVASQVGGDSEQVRAAMRLGLPSPVGAQEAIVGFLK